MNHAAPNEAGASAAAIKLKVAEAMTKDAGHAYARISPEDIVAMGAAIGDIVEMSGKRKTVCKLMPAHAESRGKSSVQMDGVSRESAGAGLGELVSIRKVACRIADQVTLAPTNVRPSERDLDYIGSLLDGLPVLEGNHLRATLFGSRWADFKVEATAPRGLGADRTDHSAHHRESCRPGPPHVPFPMKISADSSRNSSAFAK